MESCSQTTNTSGARTLSLGFEHAVKIFLRTNLTLFRAWSQWNMDLFLILQLLNSLLYFRDFFVVSAFLTFQISFKVAFKNYIIVNKSFSSNLWLRIKAQFNIIIKRNILLKPMFIYKFVETDLLKFFTSLGTISVR